MSFAVAYMHENGFAHLDLKLNNILLDELFNIRIGDFGSAIQCKPKGFKIKRKRGT
jgi:serine/threonine protein kinase